MKKIALLLLIFSTAVTFAQQQVKHKVKSGETVYGLSLKYKIKEKDIFDANPKIKNKPLQIGTVLIIPNQKNAKKISTEKPKTYTVQKGDSFYAIAKSFDMKVRELVEANPKVNPNRIKPGTTLNLVKPQTPKTVKPKEEVEKEEEELDNIEESVYQDVIHVVKRGETLYSISKEYEISVDSLRTLNPNLQNTLPTNYQLLVKKGVVAEEEEKVVEVVKNDDESEIEDYTDVPSYETLEKADRVITGAKNFLGTRYRYGGRSFSGIDCSGLVCESFNEIGMILPRTSSSMAVTYKKVKKKNAKPGDLIFFVTRGKRISHVGIVTEIVDGDIKFIHSSSSSGVIVSSLSEAYYAKRFAQISRVLD